MNVHQYEDDIMQLRNIHVAIEGLAHSSEAIAELHGHDAFFAAMAFLVDEANARVDRLDELFELSITMHQKLTNR